MIEYPTIGGLYKSATLTEQIIAAAVEAFMSDPTTTDFECGDGYQINLAETVRSHEWASVNVGLKEATDHLKRAAVRTAIMLARPLKI